MASYSIRAGRARALLRSASRRLLVVAAPVGAVAFSACVAGNPVPVSVAASAVPTQTSAASVVPTHTTGASVVSTQPAAATVAAPTPSGLGGKEWTTVPTTSKVVALTFDAGANADGVSSILATLKAQNVPASFFLTGAFVVNFPAKALDIVASGARIGDHSMNHLSFTGLTDAKMRDEVLSAQSKITEVTKTDPWPWFRFPNGARNAHTIAVVNSVGFVPIGWTVDTLGWEGTTGGITAQIVVNRVLANLRPGEIVLMHVGSHPTDHSTLDANALPTVIKELKARGYSFVTIDAILGYRVALAGGDLKAYGSASFGSLLGKLPAGVTAVAIAADHATGGYWVLKSNGGVENFNAPWYGSLADQLPAGVLATAIAAGRDGGYYVLTSDGDVHAYGAPAYGSMLGKLPAGVTTVGIAVNPGTGGYWLAKSNGGVENFNAPWYGSLAGKLAAGVRVTAIAAGRGGGYYVLTSNGGVYAYGAPSYGSMLGKLPAGVTAVALATDPATGGYWMLKSNGGVENFNAPWHGSLAGLLGAGQRVVGIAGQ